MWVVEGLLWGRRWFHALPRALPVVEAASQSSCAVMQLDIFDAWRKRRRFADD
jgi:hypothetical protein